MPTTVYLFLDVQLRHCDDGTILTRVYRKPTHTNRYLDFSSHHPTMHKQLLFEPYKVELMISLQLRHMHKRSTLTYIKYLKVIVTQESLLTLCHVPILHHNPPSKEVHVGLSPSLTSEVSRRHWDAFSLLWMSELCTSLAPCWGVVLSMPRTTNHPNSKPMLSTVYLALCAQRCMLVKLANSWVQGWRSIRLLWGMARLTLQL